MINGKQVRTWNAHSGGTLSAHYAQNGNIVTAGRDRTVKFWDGNGKGLFTISGFADIVMESLPFLTTVPKSSRETGLGKWVWNSADGKHLGDLNANPPTLETRVTIASEQLAKDQASLKQANEKLLPFQQKVDEMTKQVSANKNVMQETEKALQAAISDMQKTKSYFDKAIADLADKTNIQNEKSVAHETKKNELAANQQKHLTETGEFNKWNKRANERSIQLSQIKETYRKSSETQKQNQDDPSYTDAVNKARQAMEAMEKSFLHASNLTAQHKKEMERYAALIISLQTSVAQTAKSLEEASKTGSNWLSSKQEQQ